MYFGFALTLWFHLRSNCVLKVFQSCYTTQAKRDRELYGAFWDWGVGDGSLRAECFWLQFEVNYGARPLFTIIIVIALFHFNMANGCFIRRVTVLFCACWFHTARDGFILFCFIFCFICFYMVMCLKLSSTKIDNIVLAGILTFIFYWETCYFIYR